jgi:soluble lytic murein transglycosylase-like protein
MLARAGQEHNVDVDLLASIVRAESGGNAHAVSRTGAQGLMQLMPGTAADQGVKDSFEPEQNVRGGSAYLDALLTQYHDNIALALAAYNAGPKTVERYHGIPPYRETRVYVARVIHEFNRRVLARESATSRQRASNSIPQDTAAR